LDCFLNEPNPRTPMNPVNYLQLQTAQWQQPGLLQLLQHDPIHYSLQWFGRTDLMCYCVPNSHNFHILVPDAVLPHLVSWYHSVLGHTGEMNLQRTIQLVFFHWHMNNAIWEHVQSCDACQWNKLMGKGYGQLPPREANFQPWLSWNDFGLHRMWLSEHINVSIHWWDHQCFW
jgi:hypothetical protein